MSAPFRDQSLAPGSANAFATHIGLARDALAQVDRIPQQVANLKTGKGVDQSLMDMFVHEFSKRWETVWDQLKEARQIAASNHRDVSAFDAARAAAGDIYLPAEGKAISSYDRVDIKWRSASTQPAHDAIAALMAAMPDVVVTEQAPLEVDLRSSGKKLVDALVVAVSAGVLALVAYGLYRAFMG